MALRDDLLPIVDELRSLPNDLGLRRYAVTLRRRVWSGASVAQGTAVNEDLVLSPPPRVEDAFSGSGGGGWSQLEYILQYGHTITDRYFKISRITPQYTDPTTGAVLGGWTPAQLRMNPPPDAQNIECVVVLVGDDGVQRECIQMSLDLDRSFGYTMLVKETDRPKAGLLGLTAAIALRQLVVTGVYAGGSTSLVTPLCVFRSDAPSVATVNTLGVITPGVSGTANLTATFGKYSATVAFTVP